MVNCFQIKVLKYPNKAFLLPNLDIFIFHEILQLDKFEGADFKYDSVIFKLQPKNTRIRDFWSQI